jgi:hypothetical protein
MSSTADSSASLFAIPSSIPTGQGGSLKSASGQFWLNGEVAGCQCPDCGGPMSIRLWLMLADCALCGASIELSEEQERELQALIERVAPPPPPVAKPPAAKSVAPEVKPAAKPATREQPRPTQQQTQTLVKPRTQPETKPRSQPQPTPPPQTVVPATVVAPPIAPAVVAPPAATAQPARAVDEDEHEQQPSTNWWALLASMIFHMLLVMILALISIKHEPPKKPVVFLTATWGTKEKPGDKKNPNPDDQRPVRIESGKEQTKEPPKPNPPQPTPAEKPKAAKPQEEIKPELKALNFTPDDLAVKKLPEIQTVKSELSSPETARMHVGRDPRIRSQMVQHEGGTPESEAAVANGLRWLSRHQHESGAWGLRSFPEADACKGRCIDAGNIESHIAATGMALLPMLGAGQTPTLGIYKEHVKRGLAYLIEKQKSDGDLRTSAGNMYAHGIASIVLCEAYALTGDEQFRKPAQRAIDYIVAAQHNRGGWRYSPKQEGDLSVTGWQLMALQSARSAGLNVPEKTFTKLQRFMDEVQAGEQGGLYCYIVGRAPDNAMTAEGLLCREYLGWDKEHPGLKEGTKYLLDHLPRKDNHNIYYWYYGTMAMHHLGGEPWQKWNSAVREALIDSQELVGHEAGSWRPTGGAIHGHDVSQGGRLYVTALAICTLEVYYRHLPLYRKVEIK